MNLKIETFSLQRYLNTYYIIFIFSQFTEL